MMRTHSSLLHWLIAPLLLSVPLAMVPVQAQSAQAKPQSLGIGVYTFTSGPAAAYGVPGYNAAQVIIKEINAGGGVDGVPIKATYVDEAQGTEGVLAQFRRLSADSSVQAMIAALSSSNCLALAPVADQLKMPMVAWNCDTFQLFSNKHYEYVSRANSSVIPEFLSYALYFLQAHKDAKRIAIIGPDYALGHDADEIIKAAFKRFAPHAEIVAELYPKLGAPTFLTEVSRLMASKPDAVFVNLWGSDLQTFIRQAQPRGLVSKSQVVLTLGESVLEYLGADMPEGVIVGALGDGWWLSPTAQANPAAKKFVSDYHAEFKKYPEFPSFKMANAILALKAGYERAIKDNGGAWPTKEQLAKAMAGLELKTLTGTLTIRSQDHDGLMDQIVGTTKKSGEYPFRVLGNMVRYPAGKVTPPAGADPFKWIAALPDDFGAQLPKPGSYK